MNDRATRQLLQGTFNRLYRPPTPGFEARLRSALESAPRVAPKTNLALGIAAAVLAFLVVLSLLAARLSILPTHVPVGSRSTPTVHRVYQSPTFIWSPTLPTPSGR